MISSGIWTDDVRRSIVRTARNLHWATETAENGSRLRRRRSDLKRRLSAFVQAPVDSDVQSVEQLPATYDCPRRRWQPKPGEPEWEVESIPLVVREGERTAPRELLSVLRLVDAGRVSVSDKTRRPSASTMKAIAAVLEGGDFYEDKPQKDKWRDENAGPIRAFALPLLIQAGGLAQLSGTKLQLTKAGRKALADSSADTLKTLWLKWCATTLIDELSRIECVKGQSGKGKRGLTSVSGRRETIASALSECPSQRWILVDDFARFLRASGNAVHVTRNAWNLYLCDPEYGSLGYEGWSSYLDGRYLLCLLFEYAATLGLLDVAYLPPARARSDFHEMWGTDGMLFFSRYDGLTYFRLNGLGAFCSNAVERYTPAPLPEKPVIQVLSTLEVTAGGAALDYGDRLALDCYAERVSDVVWILNASRLLAATEEGRSVDGIREFLETRSGAPLPDAVAHLLEDVSARGTRFHDRGLARLVECADGALAELVANDSRTRKHCMRAGARHLVVPATSEATFRRGLRDVGYLVAGDGARAPMATVQASIRKATGAGEKT
ncbi:MAG TPA: hypothetical protein DFS52_03265 [Myxococcales bacterium]|nr:hypothetical protein [Myxococcales bacterium]